MADPGPFQGRAGLALQVIRLASLGSHREAVALMAEHDDARCTFALQVACTAAGFIVSQMFPHHRAGDTTLTVQIDYAKATNRAASERLGAFLAAVGNNDLTGATELFYSRLDPDRSAASHAAGQLASDVLLSAAQLLRARNASTN